MCVLAGDSTVGKSALTQSFASDGTQFPKAYAMVSSISMAIPSDFQSKSMDHNPSLNPSPGPYIIIVGARGKSRLL